MELLYNPDRMPEEEIKATFVAREALVDELVELIKNQPDGAGVQHAVIIAPRGMGKTTVLLMVKFAIKDRGLADQWQAVKFPEESYGIYDLSDFWIETLELIAADTGGDELTQLADHLKTKYQNNDDLQEAAYAALKDWRRKHGRRLLLLVENFDQILEQINDERDNARLRDVMMNDGTLMLLGGTTTFFKEARAYDQPLYNFFKIYNLYDLKFEQMQELLRRRAKIDRVTSFETSLQQNEGRLRVLEYFTGGSPRLVLMLYRVVTQSNVGEVRRSLEKLLDEVTPYYKAKIEILPPQQRKILDHIARVSGQTNEGLTPKEIAEAVRLPQNQVSAQLKRLSEDSYVRTANLRGRSSCYVLSEPLYAIWHQMRFGRSARERMYWLVSFLKVWYAAEEMGAESERLERSFRAEMSANDTQKARDLLEHHRYLTEAISDTHLRTQALERVIRGHLELNDAETVKGDLLIGINLSDLTNETLSALLVSDCVSNEEVDQAKASKSESVSAQDKQLAEAMAAAALAYREKRNEDALKLINQALEIKPDDDKTWFIRGLALGNLGRHEEAVASFDRALKTKPHDDKAWINRGIALGRLGKFETAVESFDRALKIKPDDDKAWFGRGLALGNLGRHEEAVANFDRALKTKPHDDKAWINRGIALGKLGKFETAVESFDQALKIKPDDGMVWSARGFALENLGRHEEAMSSFDKALVGKPNDGAALFLRSLALKNSDRLEEAVTSFDQALMDKPDDDKTWFIRGLALIKLGRHEEAAASFDRTLEIRSDIDAAWFSRGLALGNLGRHEEAVASFDRALAIKPKLDTAWFNRGIALGRLNRDEEAIASFDRSLEIKPDYYKAWKNRGIALRNLDRHEEAVASFDRFLEIRHDDDEIWFIRGIMLEELGRHEEAVASFDRALEIMSNLDAAWFMRGIALGNTSRYEEAVASFDRALNIEPDNDDAWYNRGIAILSWFVELAQQEKFDLAREKWNEALASVEKSNDEDWPEEVTEMLLEVAKAGHLVFARQLIAEAGMEERLFPLARAIDYLQTGNEALIEKLSPEVRGIVEEVVAKLRTAAQPAKS